MNKVLEKIFREVDALPEDRQQRIARLIEAEVEKAKREADASDGRWARLAERLHHEAPMAGKSEKFLESVRQFCEHFDTTIK